MTRMAATEPDCIFDELWVAGEPVGIDGDGARDSIQRIILQAAGAVPRVPVGCLADPRASERAFPLGPQRFRPAVIGAFGGGQVQVPAPV